MIKATPMVQQYLSIKCNYPDAILFYRMGDFYEMFFEDAKVASQVLEIALTSRNKNEENSIPMCGVPHHAAQGYIARLIENGYKVAICEQMEDPSKAKGLVKREVIEVVTPGLVLDPEILDAKRNNFIVAVDFHHERYGVACLDISTGTFRVTESGDFQRVLDECQRIEPREAVVAESLRSNPQISNLVEVLNGTSVTYVQDEIFEPGLTKTRLLKQFRTLSLEGYGCSDWLAGISAAGGLLRYVDENHKASLVHVAGISSYSLLDFMVVDETTTRNLELVTTIRGGKKRGSLLDAMDCTVTAMGGRTIRAWLQYPLIDVESIRERLDAVEEVKDNLTARRIIRRILATIHDLERLNGKIALDRCTARDLVALKNSASSLPELEQAIKGLSTESFAALQSSWDSLSDLKELVDKSICEDPPLSLKEGGIIQTGFDPQLDELVGLTAQGKDWITQLEASERKTTGINSLKVGFNKVFGYYIEVSKTHLKSVPPHYIRKQTIANGERYITEDLKIQEAKILGAEERRAELEYALFCGIRKHIAANHQRIGRMARRISELDALVSLAELADRNGYCKPKVLVDGGVQLVDSRHPVVEKLVPAERFVSNSIEIDSESKQVLIITGPNMAGKSTLLRQTALLVLMAQIGSFVPAQSATIGIVDRIFTRVGASDNLAQGQSTFMVEMQETANILNTATEKSLVILDEIGRGTSTFDGLSIAWAVAEYLHDWNNKGIKTLFATHYHELTDLALTKARVKNFSVAVREWNDEIVFLRKLVAGGINRSYGIQVARLAGVPLSIIERAKEILNNIEAGELDGLGVPNVGRSEKRSEQKSIPPRGVQLSLFQPQEHVVVSLLRDMEIDKMTPLEALNKLSTLKEVVDRE